MRQSLSLEEGVLDTNEDGTLLKDKQLKHTSPIEKKICSSSDTSGKSSGSSPVKNKARKKFATEEINPVDIEKLLSRQKKFFEQVDAFELITEPVTKDFEITQPLKFRQKKQNSNNHKYQSDSPQTKLPDSETFFEQLPTISSKDFDNENTDDTFTQIATPPKKTDSTVVSDTSQPTDYLSSDKSTTQLDKNFNDSTLEKNSASSRINSAVSNDAEKKNSKVTIKKFPSEKKSNFSFDNLSKKSKKKRSTPSKSMQNSSTKSKQSKRRESSFAARQNQKSEFDFLTSADTGKFKSRQKRQ